MRGTRSWALLVAVTAALVVPAGRSEARPQQVDVGPDRFTPAEVKVDVEETVRWVIREDQHTITSDDGLFDSGPAGPGSIFVARFHNAGRFAYYCATHGGPGGQGMSGVVVVGDPRRAEPAEISTTSTTRPPQSTTTTTSAAPAAQPPATSAPPPLPPVARPAAAASSPPPEPAKTAPPAGPIHTGLSPTSATTSITVPPDTSTTTAPPAPPEPPPAEVTRGAPHATGDGSETRDLYRLDRKALQRRLTAATAESGDRDGTDALVVAGGTLLALAGLALVVPGWRTRRR